ncbi:MAG TPA: PDZ domain-containing protein [Thermoanaerobacterales bacterium]|nr:PDZ domain-containing protein [Thermoanaerobacterales bacterium]
MFPFFKIIYLILQGLPQAILNPFFWIVVLIVWTQYNKTAEMEKRMFGTVKIKPQEKVLYAIFYGCLGGLAGSLVVMLLGVSITEAGLVYVWPLALLLMLVHPHFMCFSYAGGLISLFSLVFGFPRVDVAGLMALVAVLHLVESTLIFFAGYINATPVFIKNEKYGIIGGFSLQEFWPVPIMLLMVITAQLPQQTLIQMPDWWPLIRPFPDVLKNPNVIFMMIPVVAALGYGDVALTGIPKKRCRSSALNLLAFSGILLALSVLASRARIFAFIAAVFAPVAHEFLIIYGKKSEKSNKPLFVHPPQGERILDVIKGSPAERMGLGPGDIILSINGRDIKSREDLEEILSQYPAYIWMTVKKVDGRIKNAEMNAYPGGINSIGAILVPENEDVACIVMEEAGLFEWIKRLLRNRAKR